MDIKSKNTNKNRAVMRIIAVIMSSLCLIGACTIMGFIARENFLNERISVRDAVNGTNYIESDSFYDQISIDVDNIYNLLSTTKMLKDATIEEASKKALTSDAINLNNKLKEREKAGMSYYAKADDIVISGGAVSAEDVKQKENISDYFSAFPAYYYNEAENGYTVSEEMSGKSVNENGVSENYSDYDNLEVLHENIAFYDGLNTGKVEVGVAFSQKYIDSANETFSDGIRRIRIDIALAAILTLMTLIFFIILIVNTGDRDEEGNIKLNVFDKWFSEIHVISAVLIFIFGGMLYSWMLIYWTLSLDSSNVKQPLSTYQIFNCAFTDVIGFIIAVIGILFIVPIIKKIKAGRFFEFTIVGKIIHSGKKSNQSSSGDKKSVIKAFLNSGSVMREVIFVITIFILISIAVTSFLFLLMGGRFAESVGAAVAAAIIMALGMVVFSMKWAKYAFMFDDIQEGAARIRSGETTYKIRGDYFNSEPDKNGNVRKLEKLASDINSIGEGFRSAIESELKSQRMKTELISNVSHDIKTPITSLITYVDLLKKEGFESENAGKYLDILDEKSQRLKKLTEDLFDAAKASSGTVTCVCEKVELMSLLNQGLGEMSSKLEEKELNVIVTGGEKKYYMWADGRLVWRILENLLNNLIKYALEKSRVYVDVKNEEEDGRVVVVMTMKNISKYQLNISPEELLMRFKRGDESRSTEGSGLGLAIARDLASIQSGSFDIEVDGDLFKAILKLPSIGPDAQAGAAGPAARAGAAGSGAPIGAAGSGAQAGAAGSGAPFGAAGSGARAGSPGSAAPIGPAGSVNHI